MNDPRDPELATDLVEYFVVVLPHRGPDGGLDVIEIGDVEDLVALSALDGDVGLLSENDLALASRAVRPGEVGLVVVAEDRWARRLRQRRARGPRPW